MEWGRLPACLGGHLARDDVLQKARFSFHRIEGWKPHVTGWKPAPLRTASEFRFNCRSRHHRPCVDAPKQLDWSGIADHGGVMGMVFVTEISPRNIFPA